MSMAQGSYLGPFIGGYAPRVSGSGGGGPTPTGTFRIGPDYGAYAGSTGITHTLATAVDLASVNLIGNHSVGVAVDLDRVDLRGDVAIAQAVDLESVNARYEVAAVGVATDLESVNVSGLTTAVGIAADLEAVNLRGDVAIAQAVDLETVNLTGNHSVGVAADLESVNLRGDVAIAQAVDLEAVNLRGDTRVKLDLAGSVIGAPFWQAVETNVAFNGTGVPSIVVNKPAGAQVGDLVLVFVGMLTLGAATAADNAGFTDVFITSGFTANLLTAQCKRRILDGSEGSSWTFTIGGGVGASHVAIEAHLIRGINSTTPVDVSVGANLEASALDPDPDSPAVTTTVANTLVFAYLFHDHAALSQTHTPVAGHLERTDFQVSGGGRTLGHHTMTRVFAATGSTGTAEHNCTETAATAAKMGRVAVAPGAVTIAT